MLVLTLLLFLRPLVGVVSQECDEGIDLCAVLDPPRNRLYGYRTTLDEATQAGQGPDPIEWVCTDCTPAMFIMLAKHGIRHLHVDRQYEVANILTPLRELIHEARANYKGTLCQEDYDYISSWAPLIEPGNSLKLTAQGWNEVKALAQRYKSRYPTLLDQPFDPLVHNFTHNDMSGHGDTTLDTARAFASGLFGTHTEVNYHTPFKPDWLLEFYKHCNFYNETVEEVPEQLVRWRSSSWMDFVLRIMEVRLGLGAGNFTVGEAETLLDSCSVEYGTRYSNAPWCVAFRREDVAAFEYSTDLYDYYRHGHAHQIIAHQSCTLLSDVLYNMIEVLQKPHRVALRWMETEALGPVMALMKLFQDPIPPRYDNFKEMKNRLWRSSLQRNMGANLVFVVFNYTDGTQLVKAFLNEYPVLIPGCSNLTCNLTEILNAWQDIALNCFLPAICDPSPPLADYDDASTEVDDVKEFEPYDLHSVVRLIMEKQEQNKLDEDANLN